MYFSGGYIIPIIKLHLEIIYKLKFPILLIDFGVRILDGKFFCEDIHKTIKIWDQMSIMIKIKHLNKEVIFCASLHEQG